MTDSADDLTPLTAALDRTEAAVTTPAPLTDTDAALIRIQAIARAAGFRLTVTEGWAACSCTTGVHPWMKRIDMDDDKDNAFTWAAPWPDRHVVHNHRFEGYTPWEVPQ